MALELDLDPTDVPPNRFVSGSEAWLLCRDGQADPALFGIAEWWSPLGRHPSDRVIDEVASAVAAASWTLIRRLYERPDLQPADKAAA